MDPAVGSGPHEEVWPVTRSAWLAGSRPRRAVFCDRARALLILLSLAGLAGCASGRGSLPAARSRDAALLQREARASRAAEPYYQLALLHYAEDQPDAALDALHRALGRDPQYAPALTLLARLLHEGQRSAEGVRYFESRPLESWPEPVRLNLALLYADLGNTVQARRILEGLQHGSQAEAAAVNLAYLDLLDERPDAASDRLARLEQRYHDAPEVLNNLALAHLRSGDVERATRLLQDVAGRFPDFAPAQLNLALLLRHYLFDETGAARAEAHFDALGTPPMSPAVVQRLFEPVVEDAAPPAPEPPAAAPPRTRPARAPERP
jgi:tetratricopeptide (TPR) repeat protein